MHPHRAGKPLGIRKGLTMDADDETRAWLIALWPIALAVAITVGVFMATGEHGCAEWRIYRTVEH